MREKDEEEQPHDRRARGAVRSSVATCWKFLQRDRISLPFYFFASPSASPGASASLSVSCFLVVIGAFALTDERMAASSVDTARVLADRDRRSIIESDSHHVKRL